MSTSHSAFQLLPEEQARQKIDQLLTAAGWIVQSKHEFDRTAALGMAVREFQTQSGPCDYLLFIEGKAAGVIEAKAAGATLSGVSMQADRYTLTLPPHVKCWSSPLPLRYESNGEEVQFCDGRDPAPRSRQVFAFHTPQTLLAWLSENSTLRTRLRAMRTDNSCALSTDNLRACQVEAVTGLEASLAADQSRALIQMATGAGKTFTACTFSWRLLKYAGARRILFLVDRTNLGDQTLKEYQNYQPPHAAGRFTDIYNVQHLHGKTITPDAKVVISTVQRLYSLLQGENIEDEELDARDERSAFETWRDYQRDPLPVTYNPVIPIETFDIIVVDECHRSIYGLWRQVLEYFDAHIIGLTATPTKHTLGFFNKNLVSEYPYERSVLDGVNMGYEIYRIRTEVGEDGGKIPSGYTTPVRDKRTRALRYQELDEDLEYAPAQLDRSVTVPGQIRTVIRQFRDALFTELFTDRDDSWTPKTLIFAKDDNHAEEIVKIVREEFATAKDYNGEAFCRKITYRVTEKPKDLIKQFRVEAYPRIAVTVDMIATGTDIRPLEALIFMRDVRSDGYYEQMKGRGCRSISDSSLQAVTPNAVSKTRFVLVDAVGVSESRKNASQPLERKKQVSFEKLLEMVAQGLREDDALSSLAARCITLNRKLQDNEAALANLAELTGGLDLHAVAAGLLQRLDPDHIQTVRAEREQQTGAPLTPEQIAELEEEEKDNACAPFNKAAYRQALVDALRQTDLVIDDMTPDAVREAGFDLHEAQKRIDRFREFLSENADQITALQIIYGKPYAARRMTYAAITELHSALAAKPWHMDMATVWQAYRRMDIAEKKGKVRGIPVEKALTNIITLVRFAAGMDNELVPYSQRVEQLFNLWLGRQKKAGKAFSAEQLTWLGCVKEHLAANAEISLQDLGDVPEFSDRGGIFAARRFFGAELESMLDQLTESLVA
uniref:type I restriction endonuclease subunit R n=1 Tax=uncultured Bilophila sp. TaxID=529385 RepID=UPI0025E040F6|nr:DEAD/DEAH box helicase family protein [uncultured Bilophila sp.]